MDNINFEWWNQSEFPNFGFNTNSSVFRNWIELAFIKNYFQKNGKQLLSLEENITFKEPDKLFNFINNNKGKEFSTGFTLNNGKVSRVYIWNDAMLTLYYIDKNIFDISLSTINQEFMDSFLELLKAESVPRHKSKSVYVLVMTSEGPSFVSAGNANLKLEKENYEQKVLNDYDYVVSQLNSNNPFGRLVIFNGAPGTGKTHIIRGLLNDIENAVFVLIQPDMLAQLMGPQLIQPILDLKNSENEHHPIILIIEDAEKCLVPREGNMTEISSLLNFGDGIIGNLFDVRIIASTNAKKLEIDSALTRPGRLCKMVDVNQLSVEKANKIFTRLTGKEENQFNKQVTLADVYQKASHAGWSPVNEVAKVGFGM